MNKENSTDFPLDLGYSILKLGQNPSEIQETRLYKKIYIVQYVTQDAMQLELRSRDKNQVLDYGLVH